MTDKRVAGQITEKDGEKIWLVLSESTGKEGVGYTHSCGEQIIGKTVYHPIWDGPFKCSGSGRVHREIILFCPKCEYEPDENGTPIDVPFPGLAQKV